MILVGPDYPKGLAQDGQACLDWAHVIRTRPEEPQLPGGKRLRLPCWAEARSESGTDMVIKVISLFISLCWPDTADHRILSRSEGLAKVC